MKTPLRSIPTSRIANSTHKTLLACALACGFALNVFGQASNIPVPGMANPWLADATSAAGGDTAPAQSPVLVTLAQIGAGDELVFTATGSVQFDFSPPTDPPDGNTVSFRSLTHLYSADGGPENGIWGLNAPANSLVAVFLGPLPPVLGPTPPPFFSFAPDGNVPGNIDYVSLAPAIAQPFFIGDGRNASGVQQRVRVPAGATRLFLGAMDGSGWNNNNGSFLVSVQLAASPPQPPLHGGLSATVFSVNGSNSPAYPPAGPPVNGLADTVLQFAALQTGSPADLSVRVQATTTPNVESSWTDLPNSTNGQMTLDAANHQFLLGSNEYPHQQADPVYFRAVASASSYFDSISNVVGPFNLTSNNPRLSSRLDFTGNGSIADLYFRATESAAPAGISVRVQTSTTPGQESSWSDLNNGNAGHMTQSTAPNQFLLLVNNYPTTTGVYFRAIASGQGFIDSISNIMGPYDITATVPPVVSVTTANALPGSGDGHDSEHPIILDADNGAFAARVQSTTPVATVKLQVNGHTVTEYPGSPDPNAVYIAYFTPPVGEHVYEAAATNGIGARARAGTGAIYVRVVPSQAAARAGGTGSPAGTASAGRTYHVFNSGGNWADPTTWTDDTGGFGVPGPNDLAVIGSLSVNVSTFDGAGLNVGSVSLSSGGIIVGGANPFLVHGTITLFGGRFQDAVLVILESGTMNLLNPRDVDFGGYMANHGTINVHGSGGLFGATQIWNTGTINWLPALQIPANATIDPVAALRILQTTSLTGNGLITGTISALITNDGGSLITNDGGSIVAQGGGNIVAQGGGNIVAQGGGNIVAQGGGNIVAQGGGNIVAQGGGNIISTNGSGFSGNQDPSGSVAFGFSQSGGETNLSACTIVGPVTLNGGTLSGTGFIQGELINNGGYIAPGHSTGAIGVLGNFTQGSNGTTIIEAGGGSGVQFDSLQVAGAAHLEGTLDLKLINGYRPDPLDKLNPVSYASAVGSFATVSSNAQVTVNSTGITATVDPAMPNPSAGQPLNIATRMGVQTGDNVLIAGFIVSGPSGATKRVLIRGMGPSLAQLGVPGTLSDPFLELHQPDNSVVTNDDWQQGDPSQIPNGFAPSDPRESVIVATLTPGSYSAIVKGSHSETGIGIVEVYDLDPASSATLANISTRGFIGTDDNVMIGGFIIGGNEPARVLVRGIGPTLATFGVQGALDDPTLELHDANGSTISNDNWRETQESEIIATTIPPANEREPAIIATLVPGSYTAIVRGKNNTTGIGLMEAYNLQ